MSYNANARVGSFRSNAESDIIAILMLVDNTGENGRARRTSVLHVKAQPAVAEPLRVQCHNGTMSFAQERTFWRKTAGVVAIVYSFLIGVVIGTKIFQMLLTGQGSFSKAVRRRV